MRSGSAPWLPACFCATLRLDALWWAGYTRVRAVRVCGNSSVGRDNLAKVGVAGLSPVSRSENKARNPQAATGFFTSVDAWPAFSSVRYGIVVVPRVPLALLDGPISGEG